MRQASFLPVFNRLREHCSGCYELTGDRLLVERVVVDAELTTEVVGPDGRKVSIIVSGAAVDKSRMDGVKLGAGVFARVLEVGKGYFQGDAAVPLDSKAGNVLLISGLDSIRWWNNIFGLMQVGEHAIGVMAEDQILMRWDDDKAFNEYMRVAKASFNDGKGV